MHKHPTPSAPALPASKPFLKWVGGKSRLLPKLLPLLPPGGRLIEPFVGAGAVFLAADYESYVINDANADLIGAWAALQTRPREFAERACALFVEDNRSQQAYLRIRAEFNAETDRFERAVRLPYLNKFCFNGLYRVNRAGGYNVPYGWLESVPLFPWEQIKAASIKLGRCTILSGGFKGAIDLAGCGDTLYCDPPFVDSTRGSSFTAYTSGDFTCEDQEALVEASLVAVSRGAKVLISNHDTPLARELYRGWRIETLAVQRSLSAKASSRVIVNELVAMLP